MASPERPKSNNSPPPTKADLIAALADTERKLELANENENVIERFYRRNELLELRDELEAAIEEMGDFIDPLGLDDQPQNGP